MRIWRIIATKLLALMAVVLLNGCGEPQIKHFDSNSYPEKLSDWGLVVQKGEALAVHPESSVYALNTALFSDYAQKLRTVYIPAGQVASYHAEETFLFRFAYRKTPPSRCSGAVLPTFQGLTLRTSIWPITA